MNLKTVLGDKHSELNINEKIQDFMEKLSTQLPLTTGGTGLKK